MHTFTRVCLVVLLQCHAEQREHVWEETLELLSFDWFVQHNQVIRSCSERSHADAGIRMSYVHSKHVEERIKRRTEQIFSLTSQTRKNEQSNFSAGSLTTSKSDHPLNHLRPMT